MSGQTSDAGPIRAAGGIVAGVGSNFGKFAVVHRRRYRGEVALPKGKLDADEDEADAALREVREETGLHVRVRGSAGTTRYSIGNRLKVVTYFFMDVEDGAPPRPRDRKEILAVEWLTPAEALDILTHEEDRNLIARVFDLGQAGSKKLSLARRWRRCVCRTHERERLEGAIAHAKIGLRIARKDAVPPRDAWWHNAMRYLAQAERYLLAGNLHQGWASLHAAQREALQNPHDPDRLLHAAIALRQEAHKVAGWRAKVIEELICDEKGALRTDVLCGTAPKRVIDALERRDEESQTNYFKILLRRRHLKQLFILLSFGIVAFLVLSCLGSAPPPFNKIGLPSPFNNANLIVAVILFGAVGAALSVARGLLLADISAKIPAQQIGSFMIWMRPAIGATTALIAFVLLNAQAFSLFNWSVGNYSATFAVAIVAGFSERFIVGAIERIADAQDRSSKE